MCQLATIPLRSFSSRTATSQRRYVATVGCGRPVRPKRIQVEGCRDDILSWFLFVVFAWETDCCSDDGWRSSILQNAAMKHLPPGLGGFWTGPFFAVWRLRWTSSHPPKTELKFGSLGWPSDLPLLKTNPFGDLQSSRIFATCLLLIPQNRAD